VSRALPRAAILLLLVPGAALASGASGGGEEGGAELSHFAWEVFNLALLGVALFFAARRPVSAYLAERRSGVEERLQGAEKLLREAEAADIKRKAHAAAEAQGRRIVAEAESIAARIGAEATAAIQRETQRARTRLRDEAADLAVELAEERLRREVDDADRERLVDEFVTRLESGAGSAGGGPA
jgi:F-type H+-transporting ATPase subunit b